MIAVMYHTTIPFNNTRNFSDNKRACSILFIRIGVTGHHHKLYHFNLVKPDSLKGLQNYIVFGFMFHFNNNATNINESLCWMVNDEWPMGFSVCSRSPDGLDIGHSINISFWTLFWFSSSNIYPFWLFEFKWFNLVFGHWHNLNANIHTFCRSNVHELKREGQCAIKIDWHYELWFKSNVNQTTN